MRKKRKRKSKEKVFSKANITMAICSVLMSYSGVALSNTIVDLKSKETKVDTLVSSTHRIAIAFEEYNDKRFRR